MQKTRQNTLRIVSQSETQPHSSNNSLGELRDHSDNRWHNSYPGPIPALEDVGLPIHEYTGGGRVMSMEASSS